MELCGTQLKAIQFGLINPDEIRRFSVTQKGVVNGKRVDAGIYQTTLRDHSGEPIPAGLLDPRLGDPRTTPGFFGHCELARPVYHINFIDTVIQVLQSVSYTDSSLLMTDEELSKIKGKGKDLLPTIAKLCKNRKQDRDGNIQPKFKKEKDLRISYEMNDTVTELRAVDSLAILERISDEDCLKLGLNPKFARPEWMVISVLPVPPLSVRPSVAINDSNKCEDDLTHKLSSIVKSNNELVNRLKKNLPQEKIDEAVALLQYHIGTFIDNSSTILKQDKQRSGRPLRTLTQRLKTKEGRVRGNLMGKRVDYTSRTVITADPNLSLDQVGVPLEIAMTLTVPEKVTSFNIERLQKAVDNGPEYFPGANYVVKNGWRLRSGEIKDVKVDLRYVKKLKLREGWTVHRHLKNNDPVMFNRQPSLHKMSLMGHRARILKGATFRMNLSATTPYNADFDGDEMNLHVPQDIGSRTEIEEMMMVDKMIVSPQSNRPVMGIIQDSLLAAALLTQRSVFLDDSEMFTAISYNTEKKVDMPHPAVFGWDSKGKFKKLYTGKQLFSTIIPETVYLQRKSNYFDGENPHGKLMDDGFVHIDNGEIISGVMDKKSLGTSQGGLIHMIFNDLGHDEARKFINTVQKVCNYWISTHSFSIGFGDTIADDKTNQKVADILEKADNEVKELIRMRDNGEIEAMKGMSLEETFEFKVTSVLNKARDDSGKMAAKSLESNGFKTTATSGSKGSMLNISQIISTVGQQNLNGRRVQNGFIDRTLPHFQFNDDGPAARGFVKNCYYSGLTPYEFFFHAMSGREGVIQTAIKTATTGYTQRKIIKSVEDLQVQHDGTVRNAQGVIMQFLYGEDGMDGAKVEEERLDDWSDKQFVWDNLDTEIKVSELEILKMDQEQLKFTGKGAGILPVPLRRLILQARKRFKGETFRDVDYIVNSVRGLLERLEISQDKLMNKNGTLFLKIHIRMQLSSKMVIETYKMTKQAFDYVIGAVEQRFQNAKATPGEMVGVLCGQSLGEPLTQLTLNVFHTAGASARNVSMGVPRFTELIDVSKHMKTPSVSIRLDDSMKPSEVMAKMEHTTLRKVIHKFVREPLPELFQFVTEYDDETGEPIPLPTYRCIELDSELCIAKGITMQEIAYHMKDKVSVLHTSENSERWLMWFPKGSSIPLDMYLKGVEHIEKIVMRQELDTDEWVMDTDGTNLIEVLSHPGVDWIKTTSNDIVETAQVLGIEAARKLLLREIRNVISVDGTYVNYRHIAILVDAMTYRPTEKNILTPLSRHGINAVSDASVFHRASFEKTVNELSNAGIYAERDPLKSITASILMGKLSDSGTGFVDVVPDEPEFKFEDGSDDISVTGFEVGSEPESFEPESFEPESFDLKGFEVPDYDELYAENETLDYKYIPSSPKVVFKTIFNYVPSSPKVQFKRISTYIPSSP